MHSARDCEQHRARVASEVQRYASVAERRRLAHSVIENPRRG